jgi:molecular chaperone Hsp33
VELLSAALLLQARNFFSERLQLMLRSAGRAKVLVADAWPEGNIRGLLDMAEGNVAGGWLEAPGSLKVMRSNPDGKPYIGLLDLMDGPIQTQIEAYLLQSEQTQASVNLWCDPGTGEAGALLVEPMPNCPYERLARLVQAIEGLEVVPKWERKPEFLCQWINQGDDAEILFTTEVQYRCRCTKKSLVEILRGFDATERDKLFFDESPIEVRCDYCGKAFQIRRSEVVMPEEGTHGEP